MIEFKDLTKGDTVYIIDKEVVVEDTFKRVEDIGYHGSGLDVAYLKGTQGTFLKHNLYKTKKEAISQLLKVLRKKKKNIKKELRKIEDNIDEIQRSFFVECWYKIRFEAN